MEGQRRLIARTVRMTAQDWATAKMLARNTDGVRESYSAGVRIAVRTAWDINPYAEDIWISELGYLEEEATTNE